MSRGVWEPVTWQVGDRVQVRLRGECTAPGICHFAVEDGATGVVEEVKNVHPWRHPYFVGYDNEGVWDATCQIWWRGGNFAALELEPAPGAATTEGA